MGCAKSKPRPKKKEIPEKKETSIKSIMSKLSSSYGDSDSASSRSEAKNVLTLDEIQTMHRKFLEEYPKGQISKKNLKAFYKKHYPEGDAEAFANDMFSIFDADGDGTIDHNELIIEMSLLNKSPTRDQLFKKIKTSLKICSNFLTT